MIGPVLAHVAGGPSGGGWAVFRYWTWDPTLLILATLGYLYYRGLRNWPEPRPLQPWQPWMFFGGLAAVAIALASPVDALGDDLFLMHMVQHQMMVVFGIPMMLLGAPTTPVLRGMPPWARKHIVAPLMRSRPVRAAYQGLTFPVTPWALFALNMWAWHFVGGAFEAATQHGAIHFFQHWTFAFTAGLFWWTVIDPRPLRSRLVYPLRVLFLGVALFQNVALGAGITFRSEVLYPYYATRARIWGLSVMDDQQAGGLVMWVVGDMLFVVAILATLLVWLNKEEQKSKEEDKRHAADLARVSANGSGRL